MSAPRISIVAETALHYHSLGWIVVKVALRDKAPLGGKGWPSIRYTPAEIAEWAGCNVGILLGAASGDLCDIDLDCAEAIELAPHYLPVTWCFGRASKPRSHWLYICRGAKSHPFLDEVFDEAGKKKTLLEVRGDTAKGPGHQTVFPPSVHKDTGESISWDADMADGADGPRIVEWSDLVPRVANLVRATVARRAGATVGEALAFAAEYKPIVRPAPTCATDAPGGRSDVVERARKYVARMPAAVSGQGGHDAAYAVALKVVRGFGLGEADAFALLSEFNERCDPPWSERELRHKLASAAKADRVGSGFLLGGGR